MTETPQDSRGWLVAGAAISCGLVALTGCTAAGGEDDQQLHEDIDQWELPTEELTQDQLAEAVLNETEIFGENGETRSEYSGEVEDEEEELSYGDPWNTRLMPVGFGAAPMPDSEEEQYAACQQLWFGDEGDGAGGSTGAIERIFGEWRERNITAQVLQETSDTSDDASVTIYLKSRDYDVEVQGNSEIWEDFYEACTGSDAAIEPNPEEGIDGSRTIGAFQPGGVDGFAVETEASGDKMTLQFIHHDFGHNSLRMIGLNLDEEEMAEVVHTQLEKLQELD